MTGEPNNSLFQSEDDNRERLRAANLPCFATASLVLEAGAPIVETLKTPEHRSESRFVEVTVLTIVVAALRKLRSVVVLCEIGHVEDASVVLRSLFELTLAGHFILDGLRRSDDAMEVPAGEDPRHFRAGLYYGWRILKLESLKPDSKELREAADKIRKHLAALAIKRMKERPYTYSGLNVKQLAARYGAADFYKTVYALQSDLVHGITGFHMLAPEDDGTVAFNFATDFDSVRLPVDIGSAFVCRLLKIANSSLKLGADLSHLEVNVEGTFT
jgi:hypothetical protein